MAILLIIEVISGIVALLLAAAAFVNLSWAEGMSSQAIRREALRKTKGLFAAAGVFAAITFLCAYLVTR